MVSSLGVIFLIVVIIVIIAAAIGKLDVVLGCGGYLGTIIVWGIVIFVFIGLCRTCEEAEEEKEEFRRVSDEWSEDIRKRKEEMKAYEFELKQKRETEKNNKLP